jgi:hypothetical protein
MTVTDAPHSRVFNFYSENNPQYIEAGRPITSRQILEFALCRLQLECADRYNSVYTADANAPGGLAILLNQKEQSKASALSPLVPNPGNLF